MIRHLPVDISISPGSCILGALILLILPFELLVAAFMSALIHEMFHLLALFCCGARILQIKIGISGAVIRASPLPPAQELICALAGPAGSLLCLILIRYFPLLALCGCIQGLYNLLPIYPLDGGRILHCALHLCLPRSARRLSAIISQWISALITLGCIFLLFYTSDAFFLLLGVFFCSRIQLGRKTPCKDGVHWVQ